METPEELSYPQASEADLQSVVATDTDTDSDAGESDESLLMTAMVCGAFVAGSFLAKAWARRNTTWVFWKHFWKH
jgi:hypothetical protein